MNIYTAIGIVLLIALCRSDFEQSGLARDSLTGIEDLLKANQYSQPKISTRLSLYNDGAIEFYVYTNSSTTKVYYNEASLLSSISEFNTSWNTAFVIHGWINSHTDLITLIDALVEHGEINVIAVDWATYSYLGYVASVTLLSSVGGTVAKFIEGMQEAYDYSPDSVIIMGHSLGSHVSGFAGKSLNGSVGVIIGLDPAGPLFLEALPGSRLNATDAQYVQAIHTNAKMFGVDYNLADDDFWVNDGSVQPGCDNVFELIMCSHNRSFILMAESINDDNFYGVECDSYSDYLDGECANNTELRMGSLIYNTSSTGVFYLNTSSTYPYALGDIYGDYDE